MFDIPAGGWGAPQLSRGPTRPSAAQGGGPGHARPVEARVKQGCAEFYPNVDPRVWYRVVLNGEFRDDMEGFWIQINDWVTYVLSKDFDVQEQPDRN